MTWLLLTILACSDDAAPEAPPPVATETRPDLLLVTIDTLRADRVGAYGDPLAQTPVMDKLAAEGVLFRESHATIPLTLPSHASMFTGLVPSGHGIRDNAGFRLAEGVPTVAEKLKAQGYNTAAFVSAFVLDGAWGLDRGFDTYRDPFHPSDLAKVGAFGEVELPSAEVVNAAASWWKQNGAKPGAVARVDAAPVAPRFAWVHMYDPHTPWSMHPDCPSDPYRCEVAYADRMLGRLVDAVGKDTTVVVTSDHGEGLWDHGEREHGVLLGRTITRVPMIVRPAGGLKAAPATVAPRGTSAHPVGRPEGIDGDLVLEPGVPDAPQAARVVDQPVSGVDIGPTLAALGGTTLPGDGRSLVPLLEGGSLPSQPVYAESFFPLFHYGWAGLTMAQDDTHRIEAGVHTTAVAWTTDGPGLRPLADAPAPLVAHAAALRGADTPTPGAVDAETAEALAALGYLTTVVAPEAGADPRDRIAVLSELHAAEAAPDPKESVRRLRALVDAEPGMIDARIALALQLAATGDFPGAYAETESVLEGWPDHPTALANAGWLARQLGQTAAALGHARHMQTVNPQDARGYRLEAAVQVDAEDADGVKDACKRGLAVAPDDPNLHYLLALAEIQIGDPMVAITHLEAAKNNGSRAHDLSLWLGASHQRAGNIDQAKQHYDAATREMTGDPRPWAMAGWMLYQAERCEEARPYLVNVVRRGGRDEKIQEALKGCGG